MDGHVNGGLFDQEGGERQFPQRAPRGPVTRSLVEAVRQVVREELKPIQEAMEAMLRGTARGPTAGTAEHPLPPLPTAETSDAEFTRAWDRLAYAGITDGPARRSISGAVTKAMRRLLGPDYDVCARTRRCDTGFTVAYHLRAWLLLEREGTFAAMIKAAQRKAARRSASNQEGEQKTTV